MIKSFGLSRVIQAVAATLQRIPIALQISKESVAVLLPTVAMVWSDDLHSHRAAVASAEARRIARMRQQGSELPVDCGNAGLF